MSLLNTFAELNLVSQQSPRLEVTPHRRIFGSSTNTIPAALAGTPPTPQGIGFGPTLTLQDTLVADDGLVFDYFFANIAYAAATVTVSIQGTVLQIVTPGNVIMELGSPVVASLQPLTGISLQFGPVPFISARDLDSFDKMRENISIFTPGIQPLQISLAVQFINNAVATVGCTVTMGIAYRVVHGLEEG